MEKLSILSDTLVRRLDVVTEVDVELIVLVTVACSEGTNKVWSTQVCVS